MLNRLIAFSLNNRLFICLSALLVAGAGIFTATRMPVDVLPDLNRPTVTIMTEAHAMVPEDVEQLVTLPLEQILSGATGVQRVRSSSGLGLSVIHVEFAWSTGIYRNRQIVQEKLQLARDLLPEGVTPVMTPISSIMGQIQLVGVYSRTGKTPIDEIRALMDNDLRYRISSINGVSKVITMGGAPRQLQVTVNEEQLRTHGVTIKEVAEAVHKSNLNAGGGFLNIGKKAPVITVTGLLEGPNDLEQAVVRFDPLRPVLVRDIAKVKFGPALTQIGDAGINGRPGVVMVIMKQPGADTILLTDTVNELLQLSEASISEDLVIIPDLFQQAAFIHRAVDNVMEAVRDGGILVVLILFLFLANIRTTLITLTAIPLSLAITALVFHAMGLGINTMTLGGIAVAIGALVDDAIVYMENIFRRLRENRAKPPAERKPPLQVTFRASCEVRKAIWIGTLLVTLVYVPLFFLTGLEGRLFTPIGIAYIVSIMASLLVALTVTPALCYYLLPGYVDRVTCKDSWIVQRLKRLAEKSIRFSIKHGTAVLLTLVLLVGLGLYGLSTRGTNFLPTFDEGVAQINLFLPPGTGLEASNTYGRKMEETIMGVKGVRSVARRTGRAAGDEHAEGVNVSEAIVTMDPKSGRSRAAIIEDIREQLAEQLPGIATGVDQPLAHLMSHMLSGVKAQVAIKIFGPDLARLRDLAGKVEGAISDIEGVKDLYVEAQTLVANVEIEPRREQLARYGLTVEDIAETVEHAMGNEAVSRFIQGRFSYPVVVVLEAGDRANMERIRQLYLRRENGELIRLGDVAEVRRNLTPTNINHENTSRRIAVQHNVAGRSLGEVVADVEHALAPIYEMLGEEPGYRMEISGQFEAQREASRRILLLSILSLSMMTLILYVHFASLNLSIQVMASIPMAFIGAAAYIVLSRQNLSIATLVGLISLGGIAARNAILLLDHYMHMMHEEGETFSIELIVRAGQERMVPVVMTALTSGIALIPIALSPGDPGKEILYPVATVIIGGLISCTLLDFVVRPVLFWKFGRQPAERLVRRLKEKTEQEDLI